MDIGKETEEHPVFARVRAMPEPWRTHFPKNFLEAQRFVRWTESHALHHRVLAVAHTRVEGMWCAYVKDVAGKNHDEEADDVLRRGAKLDERLARILFPRFEGVPYAY